MLHIVDNVATVQSMNPLMLSTCITPKAGTVKRRHYSTSDDLPHWKSEAGQKPCLTDIEVHDPYLYTDELLSYSTIPRCLLTASILVPQISSARYSCGDLLSISTPPLTNAACVIHLRKWK